MEYIKKKTILKKSINFLDLPACTIAINYSLALKLGCVVKQYIKSLRQKEINAVLHYSTTFIMHNNCLYFVVSRQRVGGSEKIDTSQALKLALTVHLLVKEGISFRQGGGDTLKFFSRRQSLSNFSILKSFGT